MEYNLRNLTPEQKEDLKADIKTLMRERGSMDKVRMADIDKICQINGLDLDYSDMVIKLVQNAFKKKDLQEDNIISKTSPDGEVSFEAVPEDVARKLNGTTQTDIKGNKTTVKDTGRKTMGEMEGPGKATLNQQDILNLAKDLDVCTKEALRATGNEVAYTQMFFNKAKATITVKAYFQQDADNPGKPEGQEFPYKVAEGKIVLVTNNGQDVVNISAIQTQSGTANINRDIATDSIKKTISKEEATATGEAGTTEPDSDIQDKPMMEEFGKAVEAFRKNKNKDTIKELLKSARSFPGDDIQHKFANAVQAYKSQGMAAPVEEPAAECPECSDCDIKLSESLFIRLLEFAKEDAKDDVDLHKVAENVARICAEGRCASIEDYANILGDMAQEDPEDMPSEETPKPEEPEQLQEATDPVSKLIDKINIRPELDYTVYIETKEDEGGYLEGKPSDQKMSKEELINYLQKNHGEIEACYMPGKGIVQINLKVKEQLQENEPDEVEDWDGPDYKTPGEAIFYYDPETKDIWDEYSFDPQHGKKYVTGTITCADTDVEDQSFSHEFGTEYIYVPICTEVGIEIDGISDEDDFYDTPEDKSMAEGMLTKEDYDVIREWGIEYMTERIEQY